MMKATQTFYDQEHTFKVDVKYIYNPSSYGHPI